jgi:hypothetical protein
MFINKDTLFSILQLSEMQYEMYKNFLKLTGNKKEAEIQTQIYMNSLQYATAMTNKSNEAEDN